MPITTIARGRAALAALKKNAAQEDKQHYDTISNALETLGQRVTKLENDIKAVKK